MMNVGKPKLSAGDPPPEIPSAGKVLVLGSTGHANVKAVAWEDQLPNIVDYHVCIIVAKTLSDSFLKLKKQEYFEAIAKKLCRLLDSNGKVIVLTDGYRRVKTGGYPEVISNYVWCPFVASFTSELGDTVQLSGARFVTYLGRLRRWEFHYECSEVKDLWGIEKIQQKYLVSTTPFARNREGRLLAGSHRVAVYQGHRRQSGYDGGMHMEWPTTPSMTSGEFIMLPPIQDLDERETVALLLKDLGLKEETPPPGWVEKIDVPGVASLSADIDAVVDVISVLEKQKQDLEEQLEKTKRWARILYATGSELEDIFRESLIALGAKVEPAKYASEEYVLHTSAGEMLVEVKGNTKSVSLDNLRQLLDYTVLYLRDTGKEGKGVLFGNAWRLVPPEERDTKDKPYFPDDVKRTAAKHGLALLSSKDYFDVFCKFLRGEVKGDDILEKVAHGKGVVTF